MNKDKNKECLLLDSPMLTIEKQEEILKEMRKSVCKIKENEVYGTGFFGKLPLGGENYIIILITALHVYSKLCLNNISITLNNNEDYSIDRNESRLIYVDKKKDIAIIEIKSYDKINVHALEFQVHNKNERNFENLNEKYNKKLAYVLQYPGGKESQVSYGKLNVVMNNQDNFYIRHKCSTEIGSSGSPIILLSNSKVIGVHLFGGENNYNEGFFIFEAIDLFKNEYKKKYAKKFTNCKKISKQKNLKKGKINNNTNINNSKIQKNLDAYKSSLTSQKKDTTNENSIPKKVMPKNLFKSRKSMNPPLENRNENNNKSIQNKKKFFDSKIIIDNYEDNINDKKIEFKKTEEIKIICKTFINSKNDKNQLIIKSKNFLMDCGLNDVENLNINKDLKTLKTN